MEKVRTKKSLQIALRRPKIRKRPRIEEQLVLHEDQMLYCLVRAILGDEAPTKEISVFAPQILTTYKCNSWRAKPNIEMQVLTFRKLLESTYDVLVDSKGTVGSDKQVLISSDSCPTWCRILNENCLHHKDKKPKVQAVGFQGKKLEINKVDDMTSKQAYKFARLWVEYLATKPGWIEQQAGEWLQHCNENKLSLEGLKEIGDE
ncbi:MAG: hypothetical protein ACFFDN_23310 [Candidatus Hodarchaeota archaeon]